MKNPINQNKLEEYSKFYLNMLQNMQILFHIYIDRTKKDNNRIKDLKREAETKLDKLQDEANKNINNK